jgi:hypothetical protein
MPGAFAHITLVNEATGTHYLDEYKIEGEAYDALLEYFEYCELGAVSPDYPYLALTEEHAAWADHMHLSMKTKSMILTGIEAVKSIDDPAEKKKAFSWLCGFIAHIITDVVIHPVVEQKVGPYHGNEQAHRVCEMHQDAYIYQRLNLGPIGMAEHLDSGIVKCCRPDDNQKIDATIRQVWEKVLGEFENAEMPEIDVWHERFMKIVSAVEESDKLFPLARHVAVKKGLTYPTQDMIDNQYIIGLKTPIDGVLHYNDIFDKAIHEVLRGWKILAGAIFIGTQEHQSYLANWNLDNGRDANNDLVFWA